MRVAIQGAIGSFHHIASRNWYGETTKSKITYIECPSFEAVFTALAAEDADQAIIAIENSLYGSINEVYDLLKKYNSSHSLSIVGEISEQIHQNLIALPGAKLESINTILSHPVALAQCNDFLEHVVPQAQKIEYFDTAASVTRMIALNDPKLAAIASTYAAKLAHMPILRSNIENDHQNYTRFLVIAPQPQPKQKANKASLLMQTTHNQGDLYKALSVFAQLQMNLTKLQSRPITGKVWKYQFYIDVEAVSANLKQAVDLLEQQNCRVTLLGHYCADNKKYED